MGTACFGVQPPPPPPPPPAAALGGAPPRPFVLLGFGVARQAAEEAEADRQARPEQVEQRAAELRAAQEAQPAAAGAAAARRLAGGAAILADGAGRYDPDHPQPPPPLPQHRHCLANLGNLPGHNCTN